MKKIVTLSLLILITFTLVFAAEETYLEDTNREKLASTGEEIRDKISQGVEALEKNTTEIDKVSTPLPNFLGKPTRLIFNIDDNETIDSEKLVILIGFFVILLLVLESMLSVFSSFKKGTNIILSFALAMLLALLGGINTISTQTTNITSRVEFLNALSSWEIFVVFILLIVGSKFIKKILKNRKNMTKTMKSFNRGLRVKKGADTAEILEDALD